MYGLRGVLSRHRRALKPMYIALRARARFAGRSDLKKRGPTRGPQAGEKTTSPDRVAMRVDSYLPSTFCRKSSMIVRSRSEPTDKSFAAV